MTIEEFIEKFAFAIEVDAAILQPGTHFKELEVWDSLNTLAIIAMADSEYGIALSGDDIQHSETVSDLMAVVQGRLG
jgi:acyl carrier protein